MAESDIEFPFSHTGEFTIGTGKPGALTLKAILSVPRNSNIVTGYGSLTQAINPPLHAPTFFHGLVTLEVFGPKAHQIYSLHGNPVPPSINTPFVTQLAITLDGAWGKEGKASYLFIRGFGHGSEHLTDQPVKVNWLLQE